MISLAVQFSLEPQSQVTLPPVVACAGAGSAVGGVGAIHEQVRPVAISHSPLLIFLCFRLLICTAGAVTAVGDVSTVQQQGSRHGRRSGAEGGDAAAAAPGGAAAPHHCIPGVLLMSATLNVLF